MIDMREGEYLAMRAHVKCKGSTKQYGKGIFYVTTERVVYESERNGVCFERPVLLLPGVGKKEYGKLIEEKGEDSTQNMIGIADFRPDGKHGFVLSWYENDQIYEFHAETQKHAGKRPTQQDIYWKIQEVAFHRDGHHYHGWRPSFQDGDNIIWKDGKKVECTIIQPDKIPSHVDTRPLFNIYYPKLGDRINSGEWTFRDANGFVSNEAAIMVDKLTGETFEDQYRFEKFSRLVDAIKGGNYDLETGLMSDEQLRERFQVGMRELKEWEDYFGQTARRVQKAMQGIKDDKNEMECKRDYESEYLEYVEKTKLSILVSRLLKGFGHHGTIQTHFERLTMHNEILSRVRELVRAKINEFRFVYEFDMYVFAAFDALWPKLQNGENITEVIPEIPEQKYKNLSAGVTDNEVRKFRKKLIEPL